MTRYGIIIVFVFSSLNEIFAQYENFKIALINDFDAKCVYEKKYQLMTAASAAENCFKEALDDLHDRRFALENHDEERVKLVCNDNINEKCCAKLKDFVNHCLDEEEQETVQQALEVDQAGITSLCENDAKNYRTLLDGDCYDGNVISLGLKLQKCETITLGFSKSIHLKNFYSIDNCKKYKKYYECKIEAAAECPKMENAFIDMFTAMYDATPCAA